MQQPDFIQAIENEARGRATKMLEGLAEYQEVELEVEESEHQIIWQQGAARLLDYGEDNNAPAILCIPSLINKPYILDLYPERSFIAYLRDQGFRPLILDWGEPGLRERSYHCEDYVYYTALEALRYLRRHHHGALHLLGYCMGGVFAVAMAQLAPTMMDSLILLATPWDFHAHANPIELDDETIAEYQTLILSQDTIPPVWTQSIFHLADPWHFQQKFQRFTDMIEAEQDHFVAVESWVNDGIALARHVAKECLIDWPHHNILATGKWRVKGQLIDPATITCPTFIAAPSQDRIVPSPSALALAERIPHAHLIEPACGHVSMVVGSKAKQSLWKPLVKWIGKAEKKL